MTRHVIIGTGVAGIAAAEAIRLADQQAELTMLGDDPFVYYSRPGLAYYLTGELPEKWLFPYTKQDYRALQANILQANVLGINPAEKSIELDQSRHLPYDKLLIATGAQATRLNLPGSDLKGVHKLDHLADAKSILANAKRGRTALVTGGGITALELAEGLAARGVNVHYILRSERYWPNVLDEAESTIIEKRLRHDGIHIHHQSELAEILGKNGRVVGAKLTDGRQMKADLVAYAIGIKPRLQLAQSAGIHCDRGILVDEFMQTSQADIYAAGDVAQVYDYSLGRHILDSLWSPSREQGQAAGRNMSGGKQAYRKPVAFNVTRLAGLTTTIIGAVGGGSDPDLLGIARGDSETWRQVPDALMTQDGFGVNNLRLMLGENIILGAIVMGDQKLSTALQAIVRDKMDISPLCDALLAPKAHIADILAGFWSEKQVYL